MADAYCKMSDLLIDVALFYKDIFKISVTKYAFQKSEPFGSLNSLNMMSTPLS